MSPTAGPSTVRTTSPSRVLLAGSSPSAREVASALTGLGNEVVRAEDASPGENGWTAAYAVDMPEDFDTGAWAAGLRLDNPELPIAFAWSRPGSNSWVPQCARWVERTTSPAPERWDWSRRHLGADLPPDARAAATARQLVRDLAADDDQEFQHSLVLAVSELATNAARHGRPPVHLDAVVHGAGVYLGVQDDGSGQLPRRRDANQFDEAGRGLSIVAAVADWWGVTAQLDRVLVWCDLRSPEVSADGGLSAGEPG